VEKKLVKHVEVERNLVNHVEMEREVRQACEVERKFVKHMEVERNLVNHVEVEREVRQVCGSANKSNHPIQNPLLFVTEPQARDNTTALHSAHTVCSCVPYGSHNKQLLFP
jgi:hypothetical protein